jgi:hypothetical protein
MPRRARTSQLQAATVLWRARFGGHWNAFCAAMNFAASAANDFAASRVRVSIVSKSNYPGSESRSLYREPFRLLREAVSAADRREEVSSCTALLSHVYLSMSPW